MSTGIQWTQETWNPTTGCDKVSPGCGLPMPGAEDQPHSQCYALTMAARLKGMGQAKYQKDGDPRTSGPGFGVTEHPATLHAPLRWRAPRRVFVNSMSDLFHPRISDGFIADVWAVMASTPQHTYQILTKRAPRMAALMPDDPIDGGYRIQSAATTEAGAQALYDADWPLPNVHLGVSVEDQQRANERIHRLRATAAAVRFVSCEPLLGPVSFRWAPWVPLINGWHLDGIKGIDWVIIGGESGSGARPMDLDWARSLVRECRLAGVAPFVKQLGSAWGAKHHEPQYWPEDLRVREYPQAVTG